MQHSDEVKNSFSLWEKVGMRAFNSHNSPHPTPLPKGEGNSIGLFLGVEPHAGGMFQYAQSLLEALHALPANYLVTIACASDAWVPILAQYRFNVCTLQQSKAGLLMANVLLASCCPAPIARAISRFNPVVQQLKHMRCDVWIFPAQDTLTYQISTPTIATVHDLMHRYESQFPEVSRFRIREHRFKNLARYAKAILTDSEVGKQHVIECYGADAGKIYPLPYIPPKYIHEAKEREDFDAHYQLPKKFLFYPAQFWLHKNHKRLIDAAARLKTEIPDIHLVFTGGKRYDYEAIYAHAEATGMLSHVTFSGYVPDADLPSFYRRARALIMPTFFGPTNIPPLEAQALGCPVAISGTYGMPEQSGEAALYFHPTKTDEMAAVMKRLWQDDELCEHLRRKGAEKTAAWGQLQFNARLHEILEHVMRKS
jgi:glycosyltransferase involved in cell wall biosynthesis